MMQMIPEPAPRMAEPEHTFVVGLAMAGAISAGAYTAGVLDTLIRALAEHERRFQAGEVDHQVVLKAMSGASAGGICAAIGAAGLVQGVVAFDPNDPFRPGLPLLHELWVDRIKLTDGTDRGLLGAGDLGRDADGAERPVASILDSTHIDDEAALLVARVERGVGAAGLGYVARELDLFLTTTNLMGVTYEVNFGGGKDGHGHVMASHGNVEHFRLTGLGRNPWQSAWLERWDDSGIALPAPQEQGARIGFGDIFGDALPSAWARLVRAAVASGAFPVGLSSRRLDVSAQELGNRAWPVDTDPDLRRPEPVLPMAATVEGGEPVAVEQIGYVAVDGGVANNEPFELARFAIRDIDPGAQTWQLAANLREADRANRAVIMIDPFPEGPEMTLASADAAGRRREAGVLFALRRLLPSLINQARFKPMELLAATDSTIHSRFLVAPSRTTPEGAKLRGAMAVASGFLGGFGGFFNRVFREHDYRLGQHNCRSFLNKYFVLDSTNAVFAERTDLLPGSAPGMRRILQVADDALPDFVDANGCFHPGPPAAGAAPAERGERWPGLSLDEFEGGKRIAVDRFTRIATPLMREVGLTNRLLRRIALFLWFGIPHVWGGISQTVSGDIGNRIKGEMIARNQLLSSRYFDDPRDRALYAAIVRNGRRKASAAELAAQSEIFAPTRERPMAKLILTAQDVEDRAKAGIVRLSRHGGRWKLVAGQ